MNTRRSTRTKTNEAKTEKTIKYTKRKQVVDDEGSSSDSSVGDYLKKADEIDLSSSFFNTNNIAEPSNFETIEKKILNDVKQLSDSSDSDQAEEYVSPKKEVEAIKNTQENENRKINFTQLHEYNKKIEEAKACVQNYKSKVTQDAHNIDISHMLSVGETKAAELENTMEVLEHDVDSDDEMDWEEIEEKDTRPGDNVKIPKEGVQITVALPSVVRKKKGIDFVAAVKRRINRIKKENQIYIHKVHLLCWLAHGNFLNSVLNNESLLGMALSLLPSEQCYPPKHADMNYLEQVVRWYGKMMKLNEKKENENNMPLDQALQFQITKKEAWSKKGFVLIFIIILRSLGLQCRLVLSLQCLPLRPSSEELCSQSAKKEINTKPNKDKVETKISEKNLGHATPSTSKTNTSLTKKVSSSNIKSTVPVTSKSKSIKGNKNKINQSLSKLDRSISEKLHSSKNKSLKSKQEIKEKHTSKQKQKKSTETTKGSDTSQKGKLLNEKKKVSEEVKTRTSTRRSTGKCDNKSNIKIPQVDGADDLEIPSKEKNTRKPNLKKLKENKVTNTKRNSSEVRRESNKEMSDPDFKTDVNKNKSKRLKVVSNDKKKNESSSSHDINKRNKSKKFDVRQDIINIIKDQMLEQKHSNAKKVIKKHRKYESDDSDYVPELYSTEPVAKKRKSSDSEKDFKVNTNVKRRVKPRSELDRRVLSTDDDDSGQEVKKRKGTDIWLEVFLESEEKWISADLIKGQVHCVSELYSRASQPVSYILAWNNNLSIKDVTARYCTRWNTVTRKLRVNSLWWKESLKPFMGVKTSRDREEDEDLARQQLDQPLPKTISEYKDHPLYVLKRHLLKFQGIYPPDALTLGFVRNEPVYARECVYTLHSREIWVKHAKVVKLAQTPYKIVKARPKYDKLSGTLITDQPLELFGSWQVEDYVPPVAENGVVPRNAFGNVELFKACMLPTGTVHLQLPGLNKVARKLQIDCASAVVGFDFHGGWSHPTFDGFVVCEEFKDILIAAWEQDQIETARKEQEKYEKRVYDNWRKLIKGLLIRERLKARYDFGDSSTSGSGKSKKSKGPKVVLKKRRIQSDDESE